MSSSTLICTVGGSHIPIIKAIQQAQADKVCFICTGKDPATNQPGSRGQIDGNGLVIKEKFNDEKPTLPNIPSQLQLAPENWDILEVSPDNFDDIYATITDYVSKASPQKTFIADYTGGTKSMSAALVTVALDQNIPLQLVTGARANLVKVASGTESVLPASVANTRAQRTLQQALSYWRDHSYESAVSLQEDNPTPTDRNLGSQWQQVQALSKSFVAWDQFNHQQAMKYLQPFRSIVGQHFQPQITMLTTLVSDHLACEPLRLFDLWRNAQRRARQKRYDDAVARLYRLTEWTAQWLLESKTGIKTADVPVDEIPEGLSLTQNTQGQYQAGLLNAWQLVAHHCGEKARTFWIQQESTLIDLLKSRNHSILAHGYTPLDEAKHAAFSEWVENKLIPLLLSYTTPLPINIKTPPPQLPDKWSDDQQ